MADNMNVLIAYNRFGPYHIARLSRLQNYLQNNNSILHSLEYSDNDKIYAWNKENKSILRNCFTLCQVQYESKKVWSDKLYAYLHDFVKPDVMFIPGWGDAISRSLISYARTHHIKFVIMSDSSSWDAQRSVWKEFIKRWLIRGASAGFVAGEMHRAYLSKLGIASDRIFLGYDCVDNDYFVSESRRIRLNETEIRNTFSLPTRFYFAIGRLIPKKNFLGLLRAYRDAHIIDPTIPDLVIAGSGSDEQIMREFIKENNLNMSVRLIGFIQYNELPVYYSCAEAVVVPSFFEQWGLIVNESLACGTPVVCSYKTGAAQSLIYGKKCGATFDPLNKNELIEQLLAYAHINIEERIELQRECIRSVSEFSLDVYCDAIYKIMLKILV